MSEKSQEISNLNTERDNLRMDLYELLHNKFEKERGWQFWRLVGGHTLIGFILSYSILFDEWRFIALTPILYGILIMDALKYAVRMIYLQKQMIEIEARMDYPNFNWVGKYGFFGSGQKIEFQEVDLNKIPEIAQYLLIFAIYLELIVISLIVWAPVDISSDLFNIEITRVLLIFSYVIFTMLFFLVIFIAYIHYKRVNIRIKKLTESID